MKKLLFLLLPFTGFAQIPAYYDGIDFKVSKDDLRADLSDLVTATHTKQLVYTPGVWETLLQADLDPTDDSKVLLIYGYDDNLEDKFHRTRDKNKRNTGCSAGNCTGLWEREHVFPKSLAIPVLDTDKPGTGTDAHNLRAVDRQMNSSRSNKPFTEGNGNAKTVNSNFYPGDEWIGDVARILMYMYIRYETQCNANAVVKGSTNIADVNMPDLLLKWNAIDPPSEYEIVRNEVISLQQGNRNPFIDNPYLATLTWGGTEAQNNWIELSNINYTQEDINIEVFPNPTSDIVNIEAKSFKSAKLYTIEGIILQSDLKNKFSISQYPAGIYILTIQLENGKIVTKKIVKK
ncbi:endonuclease [Faecalibacter rhinopitheci]|uniref:Endonuclease n=1 Tax=Faecalibacter rhinopitheci TaxID=2779678 RepID=A0A8J7FQL1_9FLAO|nr:endonuclease [Faecalibacter rhinopitheci]MBF0596473.1 endonuclease [Faecalibacter rhinopitheci]